MTLPLGDAFDVDAELGTVLGQLRFDVESLLSAVDSLPARWETTERRIEEVRRLARRVEARAADAEDSVRLLSGSVRRIDARVGSLERLVRAQEPAPPTAALDAPDPTTTRLLELVRAGEVAASHLLDDGERREFQARVDAHAEAVRERAARLDACLAASRVLAGTPPDDPAHRAAAPDFRAAHAATDAAQARIRELAPMAVRAAELLGEDERQAAARREELDAGRRAERDLHAVLVERVREAVTGAVLLPDWFSAALGPVPAGESASDPWLRTAGDVLLHRMRHGVNESGSALGAEPDAGHPSAAGHRRLAQRLRELGTHPSATASGPATYG